MVISRLGRGSRSRSLKVGRWTGAIYAAPLMAKWESFGTPWCMLGFEVSCRCFAELSPFPFPSPRQPTGLQLNNSSTPRTLRVATSIMVLLDCRTPGPAGLGGHAIRVQIDQTGQTYYAPSLPNPRCHGELNPGISRAPIDGTSLQPINVTELKIAILCRATG